LGEYEQGFPVMRQLKHQFPGHQLLVSFFSPSGYEVKKNDVFIDVINYLPIDTRSNAQQFINILNPTFAVFVKYEIWPNFIKSLSQNKIPFYLISALFHKDQLFFQFYGRWMRRYLQFFDQIYVQDRSSYELSKALDLQKVQIAGDTRYDRVYYQTQQDNQLRFMNDFVRDEYCLVIGSSWPEDEAVFIDYVNEARHKVVIAPHQVKPEAVQQLTDQLQQEYALYSTWKKTDASKNILIIDTVGLLTKIYAYASLAYVGGGMGNTGLHNILEPAAFGIPVIFGKNHEGFPEADALIQAKGGFSMATGKDFYQLAEEFYRDKNKRLKVGKNAIDFINARKGTTKIICKDLAEHLST
jgi:3-deoxy-D-manno-octulosonic-acid transferase